MIWLIAIWLLLRGSLYPMTSELCAAETKRVKKELTEKKEEANRIKKALRPKQKEKKDILRKESTSKSKEGFVLRGIT